MRLRTCPARFSVLCYRSLPAPTPVGRPWQAIGVPPGNGREARDRLLGKPLPDRAGSAVGDHHPPVNERATITKHRKRRYEGRSECRTGNCSTTLERTEAAEWRNTAHYAYWSDAASGVPAARGAQGTDGEVLAAAVMSDNRATSGEAGQTR